MFLLIDTTENKSQVVLAKDDRILRKKVFEANFAHSEKLLPEISKLLKPDSLRKQDRKKKMAAAYLAVGRALRSRDLNFMSKSLCDLKAIIVVAGPGSYTGCRVGVAVANALGFSLNIPVVGINKFEIFKNPKEKSFFTKEAVLKIIQKAQKKLKTKKIEKISLPFYEKPPHITKPKPRY